MRKVDFYYDIVSPYSYLAFETLMAKKDVMKVKLNLRPVLLGGILKEIVRIISCNRMKKRDATIGITL